MGAGVRQDLLDDGQAEAAAVALRGEEWGENLVLVARVDPAAAVAHGEHAVAPKEVDGAVAADRLHGVAQEVDQHLLELMPVDSRAPVAVEIEVQSDAALRDLRRQECEHRPDYVRG